MTDRNSHLDEPDSPQSQDWEAIGRYLTGENTPEEARHVESSLAAHPADRKLLEALEEVISAQAPDISHGLDVEGALRKVKARLHGASADVIPLRPRTGWRIAMPALAAAALLAVGVASWMSYRNRPHEVAAVSAPRMLATGVGVRDSSGFPTARRTSTRNRLQQCIQAKSSLPAPLGIVHGHDCPTAR